MKKSKVCCKAFKNHSTLDCIVHQFPYDCPDVLIIFSEHHKKWGIKIPDGGSSYSVIKFCPWCGKKL